MTEHHPRRHWLCLLVCLSCFSLDAAAQGILSHHETLHAFHGRVREVAPNGDIIVDLGSEAGVSIGLDGVVVRTEPRELFVAKVKVKNVFRGDAIIEKTSGTLAVKTGDHVFLGEPGVRPSLPVVAPPVSPPPREPERPTPVPKPPSDLPPPVRAAPDARFAGTFSGLWDSTTGGTSYRYPRTIVINADLKSGTDTIKQPTGEEKTFGITGEVVGPRFIGKNHPTPGDGWVQDDLALKLDAGGHELSVVSSSQGKTERATLYRKGHKPATPGFAGEAAWPRVMRCRKVYTSSVRSLALEPVWSQDGSKILVRTSEEGRGNQHWISSTDGTLLDPPEDPVGWDPDVSPVSGLIVSCLRNVQAGVTNHSVRLSDRNGKQVRDYDISEPAIGRPRIGPGGQTVAFQEQRMDRDPDAPKEFNKWRLGLLDLASGKVTYPTLGELETCTSPVWTSDSSLLCYIDPVADGPSGIGAVTPVTKSFAVLASTAMRSDGFPLSLGPGGSCALTIGFAIQHLCDGGGELRIDASAVNLEQQRSAFLKITDAAASRFEGSRPTAQEAFLAPDGKQLLVELHRSSSEGEKGFLAELWTAELDWLSSVPANARYVGSGPVSFKETFDDNSANWNTHSKAGEGHKLIRNGRYEIRMDEPSRFTWGNTDYDYQDFDCQVTAQRLAGPEINQYGILFRFFDKDNYYQFAVSSAKKWTFLREVDGETKILRQWADSDLLFGGDRSDTLRVKCEGPRIELYANGNLLDSFNDSSHEVGKIALFAGADGDRTGVEIAFDDFTVTPRLDAFGRPEPITGKRRSPSRPPPVANRSGRPLKDSLSVGDRVEAVRAAGQVKRGWRGTFYGLVNGTPPVCVAWDEMRGSGSMATPAVPSAHKERVWNVEWDDIRSVP